MVEEKWCDLLLLPFRLVNDVKRFWFFCCSPNLFLSLSPSLPPPLSLYARSMHALFLLPCHSVPLKSAIEKSLQQDKKRSPWKIITNSTYSTSFFVLLRVLLLQRIGRFRIHNLCVLWSKLTNEISISFNPILCHTTIQQERMQEKRREKKRGWGGGGCWRWKKSPGVNGRNEGRGVGEERCGELDKVNPNEKTFDRMKCLLLMAVYLLGVYIYLVYVCHLLL